MRVHLKGIHHVRKRLANGQIKDFYYAWRDGGPRIDASPGTPEFVRQYHEAHASLRKPKAGTLMTSDCRVQGLRGIPVPLAIDHSRIHDLYRIDRRGLR